MKRIFFTILFLSTAAYASHTYSSDKLTCTYQDLTAPNSQPQTTACSAAWLGKAHKSTMKNAAAISRGTGKSTN